MADNFRGSSRTNSSFGRSGKLITPGASDLADVAKALVVLSAGDATIIPVDNVDAGTLTFTGLAAGTVIPFQVRRVTAATALLASIDG